MLPHRRRARTRNDGAYDLSRARFLKSEFINLINHAAEIGSPVETRRPITRASGPIEESKSVP